MWCQIRYPFMHFNVSEWKHFKWVTHAHTKHYPSYKRNYIYKCTLEKKIDKPPSFSARNTATERRRYVSTKIACIITMPHRVSSCVVSARYFLLLQLLHRAMLVTWGRILIKMICICMVSIAMHILSHARGRWKGSRLCIMSEFCRKLMYTRKWATKSRKIHHLSKQIVTWNF